ncbi:hypothetical protein ACTWJ8_39890 (plasmid) [Streptomyces sp. SDT5-1]|uniref:hypothetical protein n=1 Tax=Streptomyces sp. SDT5-1 TaxID=3406418 RepID=UPI003FD4EE82
MDTLNLAKDTASLLPDGPWTAVPDDTWNPGASRLTHADGRSIRIDRARRDGYVHASVLYPHPCHFPLHGGHQPTTEMRADRGARALASALTRKLLPVYNEIHPQVVAANSAHVEAARKRDAFADHLASLVPGASVGDGHHGGGAVHVHHYGPNLSRADVDVSSQETHTINLRWISSAAAEAVMRAYAATLPDHTAAAPDPASSDTGTGAFPVEAIGPLAHEALGSDWTAEHGAAESVFTGPDQRVFRLLDDEGTLALWFDDAMGHSVPEGPLGGGAVIYPPGVWFECRSPSEPAGALAVSVAEALRSLTAT